MKQVLRCTILLIKVLYNYYRSLFRFVQYRYNKFMRGTHFINLAINGVYHFKLKLNDG